MRQAHTRERCAALPYRKILKEIMAAYARMEQEYGRILMSPCVQSATAETCPVHRLLANKETYLNIRGEKDVVRAAVWTMASLFTDRAISYRADRGFDHMRIALSVGVQKMVRSDLGASGVMFTVDTEWLPRHHYLSTRCASAR